MKAISDPNECPSVFAGVDRLGDNESNASSVKKKKKRKRKPKMRKAENISPAEENLLSKIPAGLAELIAAMKAPILDNEVEEVTKPPTKVLSRIEEVTPVRKLYIPSEEIRNNSDDDEEIASLVADPQVAEAAEIEDGDSMKDFLYKPDDANSDNDKMELLPQPKVKAKGKKNIKNKEVNDFEIDDKGRRIFNYKEYVRGLSENVNCIEVDDVSSEIPMVDICTVGTGSEMGNPRPEVNVVNEYFKEQMGINEDEYPEELDPNDVMRIEADEYPYDLSEEDKAVGKNGDILVPEQMTQEEFESSMASHVSRQRPYIKVNVFGVYEEYALADTGAAVCTISQVVLSAVRSKLAEEGLQVSTVPSKVAIKCYGGRVINNNEVVLLSLIVGDKVRVEAMPFLVVNQVGVNQGILLGSPFLDSTNTAIEYHMDGKCTMRMGEVDPVKIEVEMVGNSQKVQAVETVTLMPKKPHKIDAHFVMAHGMETSLDNVPMILQSKELEDLLGDDQSQVVHPKKGKMTFTLHNKRDQPVDILEGFDIGSVITAAAMNEAIDLSIMRGYISTVEMSETRLINCLCVEQVGTDVGIIMALDDDDYSCLGANMERASPFETDNRRHNTKRITWRGNRIYVRTNNYPSGRELSPKDLESIQEILKKGMYKKILIPYKAGRTVNLVIMRSIQDIRNCGYSVSVCAFCPTLPMKTGKGGAEEMCETCINGSLSGLLNDAEKYKVTHVNVAFPTMAKNVPEGFNVKMQGTKVAIFRFWMWTATYFLQDVNSVGFIVHMPTTYSNKEDQIKHHCLLFFKYLKMAFPKAHMTMVSLTSEKANLIWLKPVTEAFEQAKVFRDYYDATLGKPRKRNSKIPSLNFDIAIEQCSCHFCDPQKPDLKRFKSFTLISAHWGINPYWEQRIKEYEKQLRKNKAQNSAPKRKRPIKSDLPEPPELHMGEGEVPPPLGEPDEPSVGGDVDADGGVHAVQCEQSSLDSFDIGLVEAIETYGSDFTGSDQIDEVDALNSYFQLMKEANLDSDESQPVEMVDLCALSTYEVFGVHFHCEGTGNCAEKRFREVLLGQEPTVPDRIQAGNDPANCFEAKAPINDITEWVQLDHLTADQRDCVIDLLNRHHNVLSISSDDRRYIRNHYLSFEVSSEEGFYIKPYPMSSVMMEEYQRHFEALVTRGHCARDVGQNVPRIIMFSPSFLVWRNASARNSKDWTQTRLVTDYSRLNRLIDSSDRGDAIPTVDEIINGTVGARKFSIGDCSNYFPSYRIDTRTQRYCGLSAVGNNHNLYALVASLGISCYPGLTQLSSRCMLRESLKKRVLQYIDDVIIVSVGDRYPLTEKYRKLEGSSPGLDLDFLEHLQILDDFLTDADHFGILISAAKLKIFTPSFEYLGVRLEAGGLIRIPESKIKILQEFPVDSPKLTPTDLMGFIGLVNYLSSSIDSFSAKIYLLTKKAVEKAPPGQKWQLDSIHKELIRELVADARLAPARHVINYELPIHCFVDSSLFAMGVAIFNQDLESGRWLFVRHYSWRHSDHNLRVLPAVLKEAATIVKLVRCNPSLFQDVNRPATIWTDSQVLVALMVNNQLETPNPKLTRWLMCLANLPLRFNIRYTNNRTRLLKCADFISRDPRFKARYVSRFSNKLKDIPEHMRPKWNSTVTDRDIREYIQKCEYIKYPKTTKIRVPVQEQDENPQSWQDETAYEKLALQFYLPKLEWPGLGPPEPDKDVPQRPSSVITQDSALSDGESSDSGPYSNKDLASEDGPFSNKDLASGEEEEEEGEAAADGLSCASSRKPVWSELHEVYVNLETSLNAVTEEDLLGTKEERLNRVKEVAINAAPLLLNTPQMVRQFKHSMDKQETLPTDFRQLAEGQASDPKLAKVISQLLSGKAPKQVSEKYALYEGNLLMRKGKDGVYRICLSFKIMLIMAAWVHLWSHAGWNATAAALGTYFTSPFLTDVVKAVVETCLVCKFSKPKLTRKDCAAGIARKPLAAWKTLAMDHTHMTGWPGAEEYPYLLVIADTATRYTFVKPVKNQGQRLTSRILYDLLSWLPKSIDSIHTDNAQGLANSRMVQDVCKEFNVKTLTRLPARPQGGSIIERAIRSLKELFRIVDRKYKAKSYLYNCPAVFKIINYNFRRYYTLVNGKIKAVWTSPMQLAFPGVEARMKLRDLFGDRNFSMPLEEQRAWKLELQKATNDYNEERYAAQQKIDEAFDPKIQEGDIVLLMETRDKEKKLRTYKINLYKVISREKRMAKIKPLFGPAKSRTKLYKTYVGHLTKFSQTELIRHLPRSFQQALGANIPLKGGKDLPEQFWEYKHTQRGQDEAYYRKRAKRKAKGKVRTVSASSSSLGSTTDTASSSSDEELPYGLGKGNKNRKWTLPGGPLDDTYRPKALVSKPEPEFPEETDTEAPPVIIKKGNKKELPGPSDSETALTETQDKKPKKGKKWYQKIMRRGKKSKDKVKK